MSESLEKSSFNKHDPNAWADLLNPALADAGYEVVTVEVILQRHSTFRVFIDFRPDAATDKKAVGIEDCVKVTHMLGEYLDTLPEVEATFKGTYDLEVSSPGVARPLRTERDYTRFQGQEVKVHTFRPLTAQETENSGYSERNPKQKNFIGTLAEVVPDRGIRLEIAFKKDQTDSVVIPFGLISKAHLEPKFEISEPKARSSSESQARASVQEKKA